MSNSIRISTDITTTRCASSIILRGVMPRRDGTISISLAACRGGERGDGNKLASKAKMATIRAGLKAIHSGAQNVHRVSRARKVAILALLASLFP